jgi:superfamily II DNA or RNA helicase
LAKLFDNKTGQFKDKQRAENLLMLRKQVLHKAENKISALRKITREIGSERLKYCFIYVPEGKENREESEIEFEDEDSVKLIDRMLEVLKQDFPDKKFNTYIGGINKSLRKAILTGFEKGDIDVLLAMKCLDEGIDIPRAQYGIFASSSGNPRQFIQRRGRLLRNHIEKEFAYIYDMIVTPDFRSDLYSKEFYEMEKSLVKGELARVAYFADLATNTHFSLSSLKEITDFYQLNLPELIINISQ